VRVRGRV